MKQQEAESQDPLERLERENLKLKEAVMRLERENDDLAHELVTSKVQLRNRLDAAEDNIESLQAGVEKLTRLNHDLEEENKQLLLETEQVKEMCRRELQKLEEENKRSQSIITNYKQICSDLSNRLEKQQTAFKQERKQIMKIVHDCEQCRHKFELDGTIVTNGAQCGSETSSPTDEAGGDVLSSLRAQDEQIRQLELELAQTKLALVESQCRNQDLTHQLNNVAQEVKTTSGTWLSKTISSIKEAARNPSIPKEASTSNSMPTLRKDSTTNIGSG